jgi:hypothetical protein
MFPRLLALSLMLATGLAASVVATSKAQETGSSLAISTVESGETVTVNNTAVTVPPKITVVRQLPPADMPYWEFVNKRRAIRADAGKVRWHKGYHYVHPFYRTAKEIKPWYREENLIYWRKIRVRAWHAARVGVQGHRWRWYNSNFHYALSLASRTTGVSWAWLHNCDHSEGSDAFVYNKLGSGAYGPMQFMHGTFYGNVGAAFYFVRHHGAPGLPSVYMNWSSNIGQAVTAAYMFRIGQSGQWSGSGC